MYRLLSLFLFFISFNLASLLVYFCAPLLLIAYHEKPFKDWPYSMAKLKRFTSFLLLPPLFWIVRMTWLRPYGLFAKYNSFTVESLREAVVNSPGTIYDNLIYPIISLLSGKEYAALFPLIFILLIPLYFYMRKNPRNNVFHGRLLLLGVLLYFLAVFPYMVANKYIPFGRDWGSRSQILVPFGAAFIFLYGTSIFAKEFGFHPNVRALLLAFVIASSTTTQIYYYLTFQRAWFKKQAITESFRQNPVIRDNTTFVVDDRIKELSVFTSRFYEYNGMMKRAFGDEKRFAIDLCDMGADTSIERIVSAYEALMPCPQYNMSQYAPTGPMYLITIRQGPKKLPFDMVLRKTLLSWIKGYRFPEAVKDMVTVDCYPYLNKK